MNIPLNINFQQVLLHLFNFIILAGGLYILLYSPVKSFMENREQQYKQMHESAQNDTETAVKLKERYECRMQNLEKEINERMEYAVKQAQEEAGRIISDAQVKAETIISEARTEAEKERRRAVAEAQKEIMVLAAEATEKILLDNSAATAFDQFLDAAERRDMYA